jgi:hypothetical protein
VNGRFTKNSTVIYWSKKNGLTSSLIEFGSLNRNSYELFQNSPHSTEEIEDKIYSYWNSTESNNRQYIAKKYLEEIIRNNSSSKIDFRTNIISGDKPTFGAKKVCAYFASSEYENAGLNLSKNPSHFGDQVEALRGLLTVLDPNKWEIYIRRHPRNPNTRKKDAERFLWDEFNNQDHIHIIDPDSVIDSLALGSNADLIASFESTINIEFVARGFQNVVTLGPAPWNRLLPSRYLPSVQEITKYLRNNNEKISPEDIWPWAYYMAVSGTDFKIVETNRLTGEWNYKIDENQL